MNQLNRINKQQLYINILKEISKRSSCLKYKIACLIVKNDNIISYGYNGTFPKHIECYDRWKSYHLEKK